MSAALPGSTALERSMTPSVAPAQPLVADARMPGSAAAATEPRVIYVVSLFPCWSETFIVREILELLRRGVDVRIVSLKQAWEPMIQSDAQALLERVIYPPQGVAMVGRWLTAVLRRPLRSAAELGSLLMGLWHRPLELGKSGVVWMRTLALSAELERLSPRHLHAHWATYPSTAAMWLSRRMGVPYSFTAHAHDIFLHDHLLASKLRTAAFGVTISEYNRRYLAEHVSPLALQRMHVVHCGVAPAQFAMSLEGRQQGRVAAVGRLDDIKGFHHLVDACALLKRRGTPLRCHIIGDGPLKAALQAQIDSLGLSDQVRLLGALKQEQVRAELNVASVFALPSVVTPAGDRDGIPVALMEAMACGLPVVSTRVSGIPELIEHGVNGLLAEPGDARDLAACIESLLLAPEHAQRLAVQARLKIEREFDVAIETGKLHAAIV